MWKTFANFVKNKHIESYYYGTSSYRKIHF